jgi:O-antigen ligase
MPWLLASVLTGYSVFRWRWRWVTIELLLLAWSIVVLVFTFSRAGIIVLGVLGMLSLLLFRNIPEKTNIGRRISIGSKTRRLLETGLVIALLIGFIFVAGQKNEFFARIWSYWDNKNNTSLKGYFEYLGFSARFGYGETAFNVYKSHPVIGVGLGNFAFYFEEELPDRPVAAIPEILRLITPEEGRNRLITPKNFYMRVLAESGVVGLGTFLVFLFAILGCAIFLWLSPRRNPGARFWGIAGILGVISFLLVAFTFDSFAIPNMWVVFGLITAATWISFRSQESTQNLSSPAMGSMINNTAELHENPA